VVMQCPYVWREKEKMPARLQHCDWAVTPAACWSSPALLECAQWPQTVAAMHDRGNRGCPRASLLGA